MFKVLAIFLAVAAVATNASIFSGSANTGLNLLSLGSRVFQSDIQNVDSVGYGPYGGYGWGGYGVYPGLGYGAYPGYGYGYGGYYGAYPAYGYGWGYPGYGYGLGYHPGFYGYGPYVY